MRQKNTFFEYTEALILAIILALFIRGFIVQAYRIPSGSMLNTLLIGDFLLVTRFDYGVKIPFTKKEMFRTGDPKVGDIIVFKAPHQPGVDYIKRVVGLPGDVVEMRDKQLFRNGERVEEAYVRHSDPYSVVRDRDVMAPRVVPPDAYFVLGDNRDASEDSRFWGFVPRENIQGKAWFIYFSWEGFQNIRWSRIGTMLR